MTFKESIRICLKKYADFSGRASKSEYWWFLLFGFLMTLGSAIFLMPFALTELVPYRFIDLTASIISLAIFIPTLSVWARRLHDSGLSAWWLLLIIIPFLPLVLMVVAGVRAGTDGPNRFGPAPGEIDLREQYRRL